jgi:YHS domain-containing protein
MSEIESFRRELKARVKRAASAPRWPLPEFDRYMQALGPRRELFEVTAASLIASVIKPRLDALLELLPSARTIDADGPHRYCCWLAASDRFPVTAKIEFAVEHDEAVEHVYVRYQAALIPLFVQFQPHDRLTVPLEQVAPERVAEWVEKRIIEFLETYLRHDRGADDLEEDIVADPACGMRLSRSDAQERSEYRGHPYYFCSPECRERFEAAPMQFVKLRPL